MGCGASTPAKPADDEPTTAAPPPTTPPAEPKTPPAAKPNPPPASNPESTAAQPAAVVIDQPTGGVIAAASASAAPPEADPSFEPDDLDQYKLPSDGGPSASSAAESAPPPTIQPDGPVIYVLGAPGSGKTTVCSMLRERFGCVLLSAPDLMREAVQSKSTQGTMINNMLRRGSNSHSASSAVRSPRPLLSDAPRDFAAHRCRIKSGQIVPAQVTLDLLIGAMSVRKGPYVLDGFPKSIDNLEMLQAQAGPCVAALVLEADEDALTQRILERGQTSGRTDDNRETIGRRFRTYSQQALPVIDTLQRQGLVTKLDAAPSTQQVETAAGEAYEIAVASHSG